MVVRMTIYTIEYVDRVTRETHFTSNSIAIIDIYIIDIYIHIIHIYILYIMGFVMLTLIGMCLFIYIKNISENKCKYNVPHNNTKQVV